VVFTCPIQLLLYTKLKSNFISVLKAVKGKVVPVLN